MYPFSPKLPSHPGCHITLSREELWDFVLTLGLCQGENRGLSDLRILKLAHSLSSRRGLGRVPDRATLDLTKSPFSSLLSSQSREIFLLSGSMVTWLIIYLPIYWLGHHSKFRALKPLKPQGPVLCNSNALVYKETKALSLFFYCTIPLLMTKCCWWNLGEKKEV